MATTFKTPGVYVVEIPLLPPSVAQVETAIPAFIGYTQKAVGFFSAAKMDRKMDGPNPKRVSRARCW